MRISRFLEPAQCAAHLLLPQQANTLQSNLNSYFMSISVRLPIRRSKHCHSTNTSSAYSRVPILQTGVLEKFGVNCFLKAITTWRGRESNPQLPDYVRRANNSATLPP